MKRRSSYLLKIFICVLWMTPPLFPAAEETVSIDSIPSARIRLIQALEQAGFHVRSFKVDEPVAVHPRYPFRTFDYDDSRLVELRKRYHLKNLIQGAPDEWSGQQQLKDWVYRRIPGGNPESSPRTALEILERAEKGESFYCTYYAMTYIECAHALGWQSRKIGVDRKHTGGYLMGSTHHGVAEVWSNHFCKWVVIDAQSNLHFEKDGIPLSAYEVREEWLRNQGEDVHHIVGAPPRTTEKNPAMVWTVPDADEIATYYWLYVQDSASFSSDHSKFLLFEDEHNIDEIWYQNNQTFGHSQFHNAYLNDRFELTDRFQDLYWTVGIVEIEVIAVNSGAIHLELDSYCPNFAKFEMTVDGAEWKEVGPELDWKVKSGWNTLGLRTVNRAGVSGPETAFVVLLEDAL